MTGSTPNVYRYRGEQYDSDLNLYYLRARYLNPLTGRFLTTDPESGIPALPATLHKYLYVGGDPINAIDPSGRAEMFEQSMVMGGSLSAYPTISAFVGASGAWVTEFVAEAMSLAQETIITIQDISLLAYQASVASGLAKLLACSTVTLYLGRYATQEMPDWEKVSASAAIGALCRTLLVAP